MANTVQGTERLSQQAFDPLAGLDWSMHLIDPKKKDANWAYNVVNFLYGNMNYYYTYRGYDSWDNMNLIRQYSDGIQTPDIYKQMFDPQNKSERTGGNTSMVSEFTGLNWRIISVIPKYRRILEARLNKIETQIECTAVDVAAKNEKQEMKLKLSVEKYFDSILADMSKRAKLQKPIKSNLSQGISKSPTTGQALSPLKDMEFNMDDDQELQMYMDMNYFKLKEEIANEITLKAVLDLTEIDRTKKLLDRDAIDYSMLAARVYRDKNTMFPKVERLDLSRLMMPASGRNDKKDIGGWGYYEYCSFNRVIELLGDELTVDKARALYKFATTSLRGAPSAATNSYNNSRITWFDFERVKLPMVYIEFLSQNCETYEYKNTRFGTPKVKNVEFGYTTKDKASTVKQHWAQVAYCGYYIPGYPQLLGFKKLENQIRDEGNPQLCKFTGVFWEFEPKSLVEQMIPHEDNIQLAELKIQHALMKSRPSGYNYNFDSIANVFLGSPDLTPQKIIKMLQQTGSGIYRSIDENGNSIMPNGGEVHQRLIGGLITEEMEGYWQTIAHHIEMIEKIIGYSPPMAGDPSDPRISAAAQRIAASASDNATYFLTEGVKYALDDIATIVNTHVQEIIKEKGVAYNALKDMVGAVNLDVIEALDNLPLHHFGIEMREKMSEEKKEAFMAQVAAAYQKGEVDLSDLLSLEFFENYKEACALLNLRIKKKQQSAQQAQQQQAQEQQQITASLNQLKLMIAHGQQQADIQGKQITAQGEIQKELIKQKGANDRTSQDHVNKLQQNYQQANLDGQGAVLQNQLDNGQPQTQQQPQFQQ